MSAVVWVPTVLSGAACLFTGALLWDRLNTGPRLREALHRRRADRVVALMTRVLDVSEDVTVTVTLHDGSGEEISASIPAAPIWRSVLLTAMERREDYGAAPVESA